MMSRIDKSDQSMDYCTINNNEIYEKARPLQRSSPFTNDEQFEDRAHGDDLTSEEEKCPERKIFFIEHSSTGSTRSPPATSIPPLSSSSDEFSLEIPMAVADYSNEGLKTDDENGMTKPYFRSNLKSRSPSLSPLLR